jgi:catechol 2,3-dioxygenase-like lactoylglutathione lyase family enzyme
MPVLGTASAVAFLATTDFARARAFFEGILGLRLLAEDPVALVYDLAGTTMRVARVGSFDPQPFTVLGWRVADPVAVARELAGRGVVLERYAGFDQDDAGVWTAPSGARIAWFRDPDGNLLSISDR